MYGANLSFRQLDNYLEFMIGSSLLEKTTNSERDVYETTDKGKNFLQQYRQIETLLTAEDTNYPDGTKEVPMQFLRS